MRTPSSQNCRLDLAPPWAARFISGITPSITARYFSAGPSDSILRYSLDGHPALRSTASSGSRSVLAVSSFRLRARLDVSIPSASSGQRGITPAFGYGAPHSSTRGTLTLLNNALLSTHYGVVRLLRHPSAPPPVDPRVRVPPDTENLALGVGGDGELS